jgi:hypothetical protein
MTGFELLTSGSPSSLIVIRRGGIRRSDIALLEGDVPDPDEGW